VIEAIGRAVPLGEITDATREPAMRVRAVKLR
jgi:hypothetical protein